MREGDRQARDELIARHMPLARALARRHRRGTEPIDDLVQVAMLGLMKAVDGWDPDRGGHLSSYATPTILGELKHYFRDHTWGIRPPRSLQDLSLAVDRSRDELLVELGRSPTVSDLARRLDCDEDAVIAALHAGAARSLSSLDAPIRDGSDDPGRAGDLIPFVDRELERVEERLTFEWLTSVLDSRAREVLRLRFEEDLPQSEIAARLGWSQMQISRIIRASLERLHAYANGAMHPSAVPAG
jgi:RNA polymerase sigma-B factor